MVRATIFIEGTKRGGYSDAKGRFTVKNVPPGKYSVRATYIGYQPKVVKDIEVKAGQSATVNFVLAMEKKQTKEVVVTANRTRESQEAVLAERKNSAQVSDGISKEEIKRLPDSDAGQALKRVSGVTIVGDKYVYVRGVGDRYNNTTLNGVALTSTEPDKKAFAFDMFPSDLMESANIAKSFTPDLPGNFSGGLVQLNTIDFPSGFSFRVNMNSAANDNVSFQNNAFVRAPGGGTDWLATDDGTRSNIPAAMPADRREMSTLISAIRAGDTTALNRWSGIGTVFNNANLSREQTTINIPNGSLGIAYTNLFQVAENDLGVVASLNYSNGWNINTIERNTILADRSPLVRLSGINSGRTVNLGGLLNLAYKIGDATTLTLKNVINRSSDEDAVALTGQDLGYQFYDLKQISFQYVEKTLISSTLGGEHVLPFAGMTADWKAGLSYSRRAEPDFRRMRFARPTSDSTQPFTSDIPSFTELSQGSGAYAGRFFSNLADNAYTASLNLILPVDEQIKLKFGGMHENRTRTFNARSFTVVPGPNFASIDNTVFTVPDSVRFADPSRIFQGDNFRSGALGYSEDSRLADAYDATERLFAGYLMVDAPFFIDELPVRVITGARVESNVQQLNSFDLSDKRVDVNLRTTDVLPALSLVTKITKEQNLRLSASQTLARPSLREFAPFTFYDFNTQSQVQGNPTLQRALIQNADIRWEWFPDAGEVVSASVFYKNFKNAIEETIFLEQSNVARTFQNANSDARNMGVEIEVRKNFGFLGDYFKNFTVNVNYSRVTSEIEVNQGGKVDRRPMWGQSPYSFNAGLYFTDPDIGATLNLGYNVTGRKIVLVGLRGAYSFDDPHTYERPRDVVDFSYVQRLGESFEAKIVARDILNQALVWEQGGEVVQSTIRGRTFIIGLTYRIK